MEFIEVNGFWWRNDSNDFGGWAEDFDHYLIRTEDILGARKVYFTLYQDRPQENTIEELTELEITSKTKELFSKYLPSVEVSFVIAESLQSLAHRLANNIIECPTYEIQEN